MKQSNWLIILVLIVAGFLAFGFALWLFRIGDVRIQQAETHYHQGEAATTIAARKEAFNASLDLFLQLDNEYRPEFGTGRLNYNIANTYFQLGEYPLSILYYKRAERLMPRSDLVKRNLAQAYTKAGVKATEKHAELMDILSMRSFLSMPERMQLFFGLVLVTLILASTWLWTKNHLVSKVAVLSLLCALLMFLNLGITYYFSPIEGVLVHAVELRRDAGMEFAKVSEEPLPGGTSVEVVGTSPNRKWLKVVAPNGDFGYLANESVKFY